MLLEASHGSDRKEKNMNIALTISICINVFQAIFFWIWTALMVLGYKDTRDKLQKYQEDEE